MPIYVLKAIEPWTPCYDKVIDFVVRAETPTKARTLAAGHAGDENSYVWLSSNLTTCEEVLPVGSACVISRNLRPG